MDVIGIFADYDGIYEVYNDLSYTALDIDDDGNLYKTDRTGVLTVREFSRLAKSGKVSDCGVE